jgi:NADH:ubiquinone oxidoreductase subunit 4 (subunit M)
MSLPFPIRKALQRLALFALTALILASCAPVQAAYVQIDPGLQDWIVYGATLLVGFLLVKLANFPALKWLADYLGPYKAAVSAWLAGVIVQFIQAGVFDRIPQIWDNAVTILMQLIVAVIVTLYGFRLLRDRGTRGFA